MQLKIFHIYMCLYVHKYLYLCIYDFGDKTYENDLHTWSLGCKIFWVLISGRCLVDWLWFEAPHSNHPESAKQISWQIPSLMISVSTYLIHYFLSFRKLLCQCTLFSKMIWHDAIKHEYTRIKIFLVLKGQWICSQHYKPDKLLKSRILKQLGSICK